MPLLSSLLSETFRLTNVIGHIVSHFKYELEISANVLRHIERGVNIYGVSMYIMQGIREMTGIRKRKYC